MIAATAHAHAQSGALEVPYRAVARADAPEAGKLKLYSRSKALVIGMDAYTAGWPKLSNGYNDAKAVADALKAQGFEVALKRDLKADELDRTLKDFFVVDGADPEARLFLWFAGHGHTIDSEGYLVPVDAARPDDETSFRRVAISLRRFGEYMREAKAKHVLAVFDSCFSGTVFNVARTNPPPAITLATAQPSRQFVSSGEATQDVSDDGTFAKVFLAAISGLEVSADANRDGYVTGTELGIFLHDKLTNLTRNKQTPRYGKLNALGYDRGDFVFKLPSAPLSIAKLAMSAPSSAVRSELDPAAVARAAAAIEEIKSLPLLEEYIKEYDNTSAHVVANIARRRLKQLQEEQSKRSQGPQPRQRVAAQAQPTWPTVTQQAQPQPKAPSKSAPPVRDPAVGEAFRDCPVCPEMVVVPPGGFTMGSAEYDAEKPLRKITIAKPFAIGKFEVTFDEWGACVSGGGCGSNPDPSDRGWGKGRRPVISVSWNDAKDYVAWLSKRTGKSYRLLSEAEWEYGARAGSDLRYHWGNDLGTGNANCAGCGSQWDSKQTAPVGAFNANAFGLFDMHGNAWEWVEDSWYPSYQGATSDSSARQGGDAAQRVIRGGSWFNTPLNIRSSNRLKSPATSRNNVVGFRVARAL